MRQDYPHNITLKVKSNVAVAGTSLSGFCTGALGAGASLYFTGTECTKVVYTSSSSGSTGYPRESYSTATIVRSIISLDWSGLSSVASFQFPLPDQLPSSMYHKDGNGSSCSVSYQLKLQLGGREIVEVVPIQIISKPSCNPPLTYVEDRVRRRIMLACCIPKGSIETSIKVDDTRLGIGEVMKICLELVNNSSVDIKCISCQLFEQIDWHSCEHHTSDTTIVASKKVSGLKGMKGKATKQAKAKAVSPSNSDHKSINVISCEAFLRVPDSTLQTCTGNLFAIKHHLSINAQTKCGLTNVKIQVPAQITSPRRSMTTIYDYLIATEDRG
mmetsp:Transcript_15426/g.23308  ORF Transcript_15426/g.23308 Transcript_15426/m.23308 type:complete len:329 (+) Transcript_15426:1398-2384(+)|eukprot:scaffold18397_cov104-Skeletonema_dohrnii-CCMP3373.AAC.2